MFIHVNNNLFNKLFNINIIVIIDNIVIGNFIWCNGSFYVYE